MRRQIDAYEEWENVDVADDGYEDERRYGVATYAERGLAEYSSQPAANSLVGVSSSVTSYGAPLLSYSNTMTMFYQNRKQVLSFGRLTCEICRERISGWAWTGPDNKQHAHEGCYERLAWHWATMYSEQQRMGNLEEQEY